MVFLEEIMLGISILLLGGILASKASSRLGVPALLLFLMIGMLAGSEGLGGIPFNSAEQAQILGIIALAFILFSGGLDTDQETLSYVFLQGLSLSTLGVALTAGLVAIFAKYILGFGWIQGLLLGSIVSSTDAAAVFSVLRSKNINLRGRTKPLLELESGSNDPMAVFLTMAMIRLIQEPGSSPLSLVPMFLQQMAVGAVMGYTLGKLATGLLNRLRLETEGLYPVITIAMVLFTYGATSLLGGNGFLAVYLAGIAMGGGAFIHKHSLIRFHDGIAWLMQITMFLTLGLLVYPSRLVPVAVVGILVSLFLIVIARPVAVFVSLAFARLRLRQKLFTSWVGLRGAVPIILATFPLLAGVPDADFYFNIVFFIVIASVLLQGTTIALAARLLRLEGPAPRKREYPIEFIPTSKTRSDMIELTIPESSPAAGKRIMDLNLPKSALIILISRNDDFLSPRGSTVLRKGDNLLVLTDKDEVARLRFLLDPIGEQTRTADEG